MAGGWTIWIDRGGTFTDVVARDPLGCLQVRKVLSEHPGGGGDDPAVAAIRALLGVAPGEALPSGAISEVRLGTTVATNALLERRGEPVLLLINRGFGDLLAIGDQHRPDLFALQIERHLPLAYRVLEVPGRLAADGTELEALQFDAELQQALRQAVADGYRSCAVVLLHSTRNPSHELALGTLLAPFGFARITLSHRVSVQPRIVPRGHTTLLEAALAPVLHAYLDQVRAALGPGPRLRIMTSSGALVAPDLLQAKDTILSGPAGGMVGAVAAAEMAVAAAGLPPVPVVGFDMGGTSTDVFHFDPGRGELAWERLPEVELSGLRLQAAMLPIHTVAAGGGSVVRFDGQRLLVGPESAGAQPGPAAYGCGGPATLTDANLLLGRLPPLALPPVFGPSGDQPADLSASQRVFEALAAQMAQAAPGISPEAVACGALRIAIERMAAAIRRVSIQRGHDIRGAVLVCFGGAGGQHACRLAEQLGITRVLLHPLAGVLSAYGIGMAQQRVLLEQAPRQPLTPALLPELERLQAELQRLATADLERSGDLQGSELVPQVRLELRSAGSDRGLEVSWQPGAGAGDADTLISQLQKAFAARHQQLYGYAPLLAGQPLVVERLLVELIATPAVAQQAATSLGLETLKRPQSTLPEGLPESWPLWLEQPGIRQPVPLHCRSALTPGQLLQGPALVLDDTSTLVLEPHWQARMLPAGELLLEFNGMARDGMIGVVRQAAPAEAVAAAAEAVAAEAAEAAAEADVAGVQQVDPTTLELYNHRFAAIAEQMGVRLQQSARSVNIRERLDFSCALFDHQGRLVANAPHIPVHLGSMGESVAALLAAIARGERPPLAPGDVVLSNDPYGGGTHLPDITAITPVFATDETTPLPPAPQRPIAFVACRGHHADVGGITPGSMPAFSTDIAQEGLLLRNALFLHRGQLDEPFWRQRLSEGRYPVRNVDQLLADLQAQAAANRLGAVELEQLVQRHGLPQVQAYMAHVQAHAAEAVRCALGRLQGGDAAITLDDGSRIAVTVTIDQQRRRARIDCSGTTSQHPGNFNAPLAITKAVVLYVFRCLVGEPIPLNAGCFEPLELVVPEGCLLNPRPPAAVVAGNVETSQALANALFLALGVQAGAQGTMNNLSFGSAACQYYETICGGSGAGLTPEGVAYAGASAVQCHMTNSRLTDPEVLEERFPVQLERFAIRRGSGGAGRCPGGDGVIRVLQLLEPMTVSLLSGCRNMPPPGLAGGEPGACGRNRVQLPGGEMRELAGCCELDLPAGAVLSIETPGGGGYGPPG